MIQSGEFTRVGIDEARNSLNVTLRKKGLHRNADINTEVAPPLTDEEIEELKAQGRVDEDTPITRYDSATVLRIDRADEISNKHGDTALAIAETLATIRELDCARVSLMGTYTFGDYSDYVASEVLLVRNTPASVDAEASVIPPPPGPPPEDLAHHETQGGLGILTR
jgi:hypothetical protein